MGSRKGYTPNLRALKTNSRDHQFKYTTLDCDNCDFLRTVDSYQVCGWGTAFKILVGENSPEKHCEYKNKQSPENASFQRIDNFFSGKFKPVFGEYKK